MKKEDAFLKDYQLLSIPVMDEKGTPAWPEVFPPERIEEMKDRSGARHFASQMMLDPMQTDRARLDTNAIRFYDHDLDIRAARLGEIIINGYAFYWDPSSAKQKSDGSVCVFVLSDGKNQRAFIHDCLYLEVKDGDPHPIATQCTRVLNFMQGYGIKNIAIETNGFGGALPEIMRRIAADGGQALNITGAANRENKVMRILNAIEPMLGAGRLYAHRRIKSTNLMDEMDDWTPNGHGRDDGLDALAGALRMPPVTLRPRGQSIRPINAKTEFEV